MFNCAKNTIRKYTAIATRRKPTSEQFKSQWMDKWMMTLSPRQVRVLTFVVLCIYYIFLSSEIRNRWKYWDFLSLEIKDPLIIYIFFHILLSPNTLKKKYFYIINFEKTSLNNETRENRLQLIAVIHSNHWSFSGNLIADHWSLQCLSTVCRYTFALT